MAVYHIYSDESSQNSGPFMLYGAVFVPQHRAEALISDISALRARYNWNSEMKWGRVSNNKLHIYKQLVDIFFDADYCEFHCLVVEREPIDYVRYYGRLTDECYQENAFFGFYFHALDHKLNFADRYHIFPDNMDCRRPNRWLDLQTRINYHWLTHKDFSRRMSEQIVRSVEPVESKTCLPMHITDVLLGAVGFATNRIGTNAGKNALVEHIQNRLGCERLDEYDGEVSRFSVRRFDFSKVQPQESNEKQAPINPNQTG